MTAVTMTRVELALAATDLSLPRTKRHTLLGVGAPGGSRATDGVVPPAGRPAVIVRSPAVAPERGTPVGGEIRKPISDAPPAPVSPPEGRRPQSQPASPRPKSSVPPPLRSSPLPPPLPKRRPSSEAPGAPVRRPSSTPPPMYSPPQAVAASTRRASSAPPPAKTEVVEVDSPRSTSRTIGFIVAALVTVPVAGIAGAAAGRLALQLAQPEPLAATAPQQTAIAPAATEEAASAADAPSLTAPSTATARPSTLIERAKTGEPAAIEELARRPPTERTIAETLALAEGRAIDKQHKLEDLRKTILAKPELLEDKEQVARLRELVDDRDTGRPALSLLAELPGPLGPDLLYDVWIGTRERTETTALAEELVYSEEVRNKASPALQLVLALRREENCEKVIELLPIAREHADRRAIGQLKRLLLRRGCGDDELDDCYPCLRTLDFEQGAVGVKTALTAARRRLPPKLY